MLALSAANYAVANTAGSVTVSVTRIGGSSGAASIHYATMYGTALDAVDYVNTSGVLTWENGDAAAKAFVVPILHATSFTGSRILSVALSSAAGASVSTPATATVAISGATVSGTQASAAVKKSISKWVSCTGTSDDTAGATLAFAAAKNGAFTLIVDCPVLIKVGMDISRTIFIDNGTTVEFTGPGKFTVDNVFIPAFAIANSSNVTLTNWNVEYTAGLPVNPNVGGYRNNGQFVPGADPGSAFNDLRITPWLTANRGIVFNRSQGSVNSRWADPTNTSAIFFVIGDTSNVNVSGMQVYVPASAGGDRFVPVVFALAQNYKSNQTVTVKTPLTGQYIAVPHDLTFSNVVFDGTYMGWVGSVRDVIFENIQSHRYGDLQDAQGKNVGGVGKWFAPPHLFYLAYSVDGDPALFNSNIQIKGVVDDGPRVGTARDKGGSDTLSGYALSLKIGCVDCSVDTYSTNRPDGFLDVLPSNGLTISNVTATYDSAFLNNLFSGWRFPSSGYTNVTFENISLKDSASSSVALPIGPANQASNENLVFTNVQVGINRWAGQGLPLPTIAGQTNSVSLNYAMVESVSRVMAAQKGIGSLTLQATPATLSAGGSTTVKWTSRDAASCSAGGSWTGPVGTSGSRVIKLSSAGTYNFTLNCQNASSSSSTTLPLLVQ
jgi:hypothetical protein